MRRAMSMNQDFSNQFNNLTLKSIITSSKKAKQLQSRFENFQTKVNNALKIINENRAFNTTNDRYAIDPSIFLTELQNSNIVDTQRYIWHLAPSCVRYSIIEEGLLANKSIYKSVFANNDIAINKFYPMYVDGCNKTELFFTDFWRIDTFKLNSIWLADPNRCPNSKWVCTVDDIPVSAIELYTFNNYYDKACSIDFLTNNKKINSFINWRLNKAKIAS